MTGPGGVGKTRQAVHSAAQLTQEFSGKTFFVSLASASDPGAVVATIARGLGVAGRGNSPLRNRLLSELPAGSLLVVLDNVEQVAPVVASLATELNACYPQLTLLLTSRFALNVAGNRVFPVRPLRCPDAAESRGVASAAASHAVELFVARAREALPDFSLTEANVTEVAAICRRLDGLPLAIELAAALVAVLPLGQLLRQLDQRLALLSGTRLDLPQRQRSLRASIEWSVALLDAEQRKLLRRLAMFSGGFTLEAAAHVAGGAQFSWHEIGRTSLPSSTIDGIDALLAHHRLTRTEQRDSTPRFSMLETIHDYARQQLTQAGETTETASRHLAWCLRLAEHVAQKLFTAEEHVWLERLQDEDTNLQSALSCGLAPDQDHEADVELALRLAAALTEYWYVTGQLSTGREWLARAVEVSAERSPSLGRARCLIGASLIEQVRGATESAQLLGEQGLAMARMLADEPSVGRALLFLGNLAMMRGALDRARTLHAEALACFRRLDDHLWTALALGNLGMDVHRLGLLDQAAEETRGALEIARAIGNRWDTIMYLRLLGDIARERGHLEQAKELAAESLALGRLHGSDREMADSLTGLGAIATAAGDFEQACRVLRVAETIYRRHDIAVPPPLYPDWSDILDRVREGLNEVRFAAIWQTSTIDRVVADAIGPNQIGDRFRDLSRTSEC